jgi:Zn-dependent protease
VASCPVCQDPYCGSCLTQTNLGPVCASCVAEARAAGQLEAVAPDPSVASVGASVRASVGASAAAPNLDELSQRVKPSPVFLLIVGAFIASCVWAWQVRNPDHVRWSIRAVVFSGWILSLSLHEFGHAATAFVGGDRSVVSKGYLTLDPRKYAHLGLSIGLPVLFLLIGGIGLPGGAVWINRGAIRKQWMQSLMSLAGPIANLLSALLLALPFAFGLAGTETPLGAALAFLASLQISTALLNLLPVPGLDGFGALEPFLPRSWLASLAPVRQFGFFVLFLLMFRTGLGTALFDTSDAIAGGLGVPKELADIGSLPFSFRSL